MKQFTLCILLAMHGILANAMYTTATYTLDPELDQSDFSAIGSSHPNPAQNQTIIDQSMQQLVAAVHAANSIDITPLTHLTTVARSAKEDAAAAEQASVTQAHALLVTAHNSLKNVRAHITLLEKALRKEENSDEESEQEKQQDREEKKHNNEASASHQLMVHNQQCEREPQKVVSMQSGILGLAAALLLWIPYCRNHRYSRY